MGLGKVRLMIPATRCCDTQSNHIPYRQCNALRFCGGCTTASSCGAAMDQSGKKVLSQPTRTALVVAPKTVLAQWAKELQTVGLGGLVHEFVGNQSER